MGNREDRGLAALGATAAIGLRGLAEREKAERLRHLLDVVAAIVKADYMASVRAAAHPNVDAETAHDIVVAQRPDGVPINVGDMVCKLAVVVVVTDDLPLRGLHILHGTIQGPYYAVKTIVDTLIAAPQDWMDGEPEFTPGGDTATARLRIVVTDQNEPAPDFPFVAGKLM